MTLPVTPRIQVVSFRSPMAVARVLCKEKGGAFNSGLSFFCPCPAFEVPRGLVLFLDVDDRGLGSLAGLLFSLFPFWEMGPKRRVQDGS